MLVSLTKIKFIRDLSHKFNKMISINTKEWFDKVNGNTYFSAEIHLGMDLIMVLPFQYGYSGARDAVERKLAKHFGVSAERWELRDMLRKNGIEIGETRVKALKRELSKESFEDFSAFTKPENLALYAHYRMMHEKDFEFSGIDKNCFISLVRGELEYTPFASINWF